MSIDYIFIASILFYAFMVKTSADHELDVRFASIVTIGVPLVFRTILLSLVARMPLTEIFSPYVIAVFFVQLLVAFGIFYKLRVTEDKLDSWLGWTAVGGIVIYFVIPFVIEKIIF